MRVGQRENGALEMYCPGGTENCHIRLIGLLSAKDGNGGRRKAPNILSFTFITEQLSLFLESEQVDILLEIDRFRDTASEKVQ